MKKTYEKPQLEITEFRFAEHIAASGIDLGSCGSIKYDPKGNPTTSGCYRASDFV